MYVMVQYFACRIHSFFLLFLSFFKVVVEGKLSSSFYFFKGEGK